MKSILALLSADSKALKGWFRNQTFGKLFVMFGFLAVFTFVAVILYYSSLMFFMPLTSYEDYGTLTASYILHAAIIMLSLFIIGTSAVSTLTFLLSENFQMDYLLTLPITTKVLTLWIFIRNSFVNLVFFFIIFFPIGLAFIKTFPPSGLYVSLLRLIVVMVMLVLTTNALGSALGFIISRFVRGKGSWTAMLGAVLFLFFSFLVLKLILPQRLLVLYNATPSRFYSVYNSLPLSNHLFPTFWFTQAIVGGGIYIVYSFIACLVLVFGFFCYGEKQFIKVYQSLKIDTIGRLKKTKSYYKNFISTKNPVILKDRLSILRKGSELGYLVFLILLGFIFFFIINYSQSLGNRAARIENQFIIFSFLAFLFYATAYLLRIVFPLMARESKAARFIFSLPLKKEELYLQKFNFSLALSFPYLVMSILIWIILLFGKPYFFFLSLITFESVLIITVVSSLMGAIFPNFSEGDNAERVSTSAMGILTLFVASLISIINAATIYFVINGYSLSIVYFIIVSIFYILVILGLFVVFKSRLHSYEF